MVKLVYLAYRNAHKKWTMPVPNWGIISQQLAINFEDRFNLLWICYIYTDKQGSGVTNYSILAS